MRGFADLGRLILGVSLLGICCLHELFAGEDTSNGIQPLGDSELVQAEQPTVPLTIRDVGFATAYIPSKATLLNDWRLCVERPRGQRSKASDEMRKTIVTELTEHLGEGLISEDILSLVETYTSMLGQEEIEDFEKKGITIEIANNAVYFIAFRRRDYQVQVLGEVGNFASVFIRQQGGGQKSMWDSFGQLFPKLELQNMKPTMDRFSKGICDKYFVSKGRCIKGGERVSKLSR